MKKNETTQVEEKKLVWKLKDLPDAEAVASLVQTKVITPEEARGILFKEEVKQSDEVEALKLMVRVLQEMVKDLMNRPRDIQYVPYTKIVEVPNRLSPYWINAIGSSTDLGTLRLTSKTTGYAGNASYTLSVNS